MPRSGDPVDTVVLPRPGGEAGFCAMPRPRVGAPALFCGLAALACGVLSGCSGLFHNDSPATQVYVLRAPAHPQRDPMPSNGSAAP